MLLNCLALVACGQSGGRGATFHRTLGLGGRSPLDTQRAGRGCLDLPALAKSISIAERGATLHSRDYDIGRPSPKKGDHQLAFVSVTDQASRQELARRSFAGENAPVLQKSAKAADLLGQTPAKPLLEVASQEGCRSVRFASGAEFAITYGNSNFVTMTDSATGEIREYGRQGESLVMTVFAPTDITTCEGKKITGQSERISMRLAWGKNQDELSLVPSYAARLGLKASARAEEFGAKLQALPKKADELKCGS